MLGSINYQLNKNGITEGILSAESMIFWLDTADSKAKTPSFYISKGIEVAEGEEKPAERMFMFNATGFFEIFRRRLCSRIYKREILFGRYSRAET